MKNVLPNSNFSFTKWCVALIAAGWMGMGASQATVLLEENFNFTGALTSNGWTATSGAGVAVINTGTGLSYTSLPSSGVGNAAVINSPITSGGTGEDLRKVFPSGITSGSIYTSFLINLTSATSGGDYFFAAYSSATSGGGFNGRIFAKASGAGYVLGLTKSSTIVYDTTVRNFNTTYLVVLKNQISATTTTDDNVSIWVDPALASSEGTALLNSNAGNDITAAVGFDGVVIRQGSGTPAGKIDSILVGTTWANVTPAGGSSSPSVTPSVSTLTAFSTTAGTASAAQTFTVTGANLSADLTVTAPTGFEVATDGATFAASKILTQTAGAVSGTISVRIAAATAQGSPSGNVTLASMGATTANVAVSGTVTAVGAASVSVTGGTLTAFSTVLGTASAAQSFTVSGSNLTSAITVTAPTGFEVSTDATSYASSKTLTQVSGTVAATTISVRIAASTAAGTLASANVTIEATGVTTANIAVSGTVTTPALTLVLNPTTVAENAGPSASTGTVGIPASLSSDLIVNLVSTNTAAANVPASVTITSGQTSATFPIDPVAISSSYGPATTAIQASNSNYTTASATLTVTNVDVRPAPLAAKGWINEFHYDNASTDSGEFVEIVLAPGTSTSNVSVVLYNGSDGKPYTTGTPAQSTFPLSQFVAGGSSNGFLIYSLAIPGIQNGGPDGLVLIIDGVPEDLVSYEGSFLATDGPAAGYTLPDIGIAQTSSEPAGSSLYRYGPGNTGMDFAWAKATTATPGQVNAGQNLGATGVQGTGTLAIANTTASSPFLTQNIFPKATAGQTVSLTLTGTLSSGTIGAMSLVVPAAFTGLNLGNVTVSGTGAGTAATTLSGSTLTITGLIVDQLKPVTINIAGLTTPETAGDLTKDGNYTFTVQTGVDGNLQSILIQPNAVVTIPIANLGDVDANGVSLDVGKTVAVQAVCTEENFNSDNSTSAFLQSGQPDGILKAGINIYSGQRNLFVRGNEYVVTGSVLNYNGLTELVVAASSQVVQLGTATEVPIPVTLTIAELTAAHEAYEGSLVRVVGLNKVSGTWALNESGTFPTGSNITLANGGVDLTVRLNVGSTALTEPIYPAAITGIYGQFVASSPYTGGGQIQPRDQADIEDGPGLRLTFAEFFLYESTTLPLGGTPVSSVLTVSRIGGGTSGALVVALSASPTGLVQFPTSVTIPAGEETATVTVEAIDNSAFNTAGFTNVILTASASGSGLSDGSTTVMIYEDEASAPPSGTTYSEWLSGASASDAAFLDYVFGAVTPGTLEPSLKPSIAVTGGNLVLTYYVRQGTAGLTVTPKTSTDLAAGTSGWVTDGVTDIAVGTPITVNSVSVQQRTASVPVSGAKKFLRVEAVQQ